MFTLLVFSTFGGISTISNIFFKRLASLIADKKDISYDVVMSWLCCRVSFSLLHSAIDCLRGARSSKGHTAASLQAFDLSLSEGWMSLNYSFILQLSSTLRSSARGGGKGCWLHLG